MLVEAVTQTLVLFVSLVGLPILLVDETTISERQSTNGLFLPMAESWENGLTVWWIATDRSFFFMSKF